MAACLAKVKSRLSKFEFYSIEQVPHEHNTNTDPLTRLTINKEANTLNVVSVEFLNKPSIEEEVCRRDGGGGEALNLKLIDAAIIIGDSIYNLTRLGEVETDKNDHPLDPPPKILSVEELSTSDTDKKDTKKKGVKKLNLLSFGEEVEEEEKELAAVKKKIKSSHDVIDDHRLLKDAIPNDELVRLEEVLEKTLLMVQNSQKNYLYKCDQLKSIRQDLIVQRIQNQLTVKACFKTSLSFSHVYETHARLALECQSQLQSLYAKGIEGCHMEFAAYNLLCVILHYSNNRDLVSSMSRLSSEAKRDNAVRHALALRAAVTPGNYVMFFRLFKTAPNLNTCLMVCKISDDLYVEKMRFKAVSCISRSYRPTLPVSYIAQVLGFPSVASDNAEKDSDGLEECIEWLKAHGACLIADNNREMQLDAKH
ncbi:SAC3 family protein A-like [Humulus lupulus]|uniref:SAC3 family protein A-like n=1 Tax=Humulus lupulus TaxID=3486 RepID=UPI002B40DF91|nr:SAC3 family protein A-like [Humulus lupulus]